MQIASRGLALSIFSGADLQMGSVWLSCECFDFKVFLLNFTFFFPIYSSYFIMCLLHS